MEINTLFKAVFGRNINLTGVDYDNAYENEDVKAAISLMYILDKYNYNVPHNYSFAYDKKHGVIYSRELVEDIFCQSNEAGNDAQIDEDIADSIQPLHLLLDPKRKATSGFISATQYGYYASMRKPINRSEEEYYDMFPQRHPKDSYNLGKHIWKSIKDYEKTRQEAQKSNTDIDQAQPE